MFSKLYGDGIHDDTSALQELIDSGICELCLPVPEKFYLISKPLELPSNFKLKLPRYAKVKLAANSNCVMIKNKTLLTGQISSIGKRKVKPNEIIIITIKRIKYVFFIYITS